MDGTSKDPRRYSIICQSCQEQIPITPFDPVPLKHGVVFLAGLRDGYIGITCPDQGCLHTTIAKEDLATFRAIREELVQVGMPDFGFMSQPLRHHSFPLHTFSIDLLQGKNPGLPCYSCGAVDLDQGRALSEVEILIHAPSEDTEEIPSLYCSYSANDLAIGPGLTLMWYRPQDIEKAIHLENETRRIAFPRYVIHDPTLESIDTFCNDHFITKMRWQEMLQEGVSHREGWREYLEGLDPHERQDLLDRTQGEEPGTVIEVSETYKMQQNTKKSYDLLEILTTFAHDMAKSMQAWRPEGDTTFAGDSKVRGMHQEVISYFNKGFGKNFLEKNCLSFIQEYLEISNAVDFSLQKLDHLKKKFLEPLHGEMHREILATKQYAFYEEPPTWTIIFDGKPIRSLTGEGFRYLHYLVGHMNEGVTVHNLNHISGIPVEALPSSDKHYELEYRNGVKGEMAQDPLSDATSGDEIADEKYIRDLLKRKKELETEMEKTKDLNDLAEQEKISEEYEQIEAMIDEISKPEGDKRGFRKFKDDTDKIRDRIGVSIKRAITQLMKNNQKAGAHFKEAVKPYSNPLSYKPREEIKWHFE